jgi:hypothetical protein
MMFGRTVFLMLAIALFITSTFAIPVKAAPGTWSIQYMIDQSQTVLGYNQFSDPRDDRGLALSSNGQYLYAGYNNPPQVRKIDTTVADYTDATLVLLQGKRGKAIATDDMGRVYLAEGSSGGIFIYDAALSTLLATIVTGGTYGLNTPEGVATAREGTTLFLYVTDRNTDKLYKFQITEGLGVAITSVAKLWELLITPSSTELRGVEVDPNGKIWMADYGGGRALRVNNDGTGLTSTTVTQAMDISFGYGNAYVTQYTTRTITVLKQSDLSFVETLTPPWATLELDPDGQSAGGALSGIAVRESSRVLYVTNEAGQTADEHSTYGRTDGESGYIGTKFYTDLTHDDNDPILKMAFPTPPAPAVGGEWVPINTVQVLVQILSCAAVMSAIVALFVGFKRIKRKQN